MRAPLQAKSCRKRLRHSADVSAIYFVQVSQTFIKQLLEFSTNYGAVVQLGRIGDWGSSDGGSNPPGLIMSEDRKNDITKDLSICVTVGRESTRGALGYVGQEYAISAPRSCLCGVIQVGPHKCVITPNAAPKEIPLEDMDTGQIATVQYGVRKSSAFVCYYVRRIK